MSDPTNGHTEAFDLLRDVVDWADPVPEAAVAMARNVPSLARLDAELAELQESLMATRAEGDSTLVFDGSTCTIAVHVDDGFRVEIIGPRVTRVAIAGPSDTTALDLDGSSWRGGQGIAGSVRVVVTTDQGDTIGTDWFTV